MTDLLTLARTHAWWYSDQNLATQLIDLITKYEEDILQLHNTIDHLTEMIRYRDLRLAQLQEALEDAVPHLERHAPTAYNKLRTLVP